MSEGTAEDFARMIAGARNAEQPAENRGAPMSERELTPENAAVSDQSRIPADDQAELARRYGLSPELVERVRGGSWAERCEDAERLARLAESQSIRERARRHLREMQQDNPNQAELAAFEQLEGKDAALARSLGLTNGLDE